MGSAHVLARRIFILDQAIRVSQSSFLFFQGAAQHRRPDGRNRAEVKRCQVEQPQAWASSPRRSQPNERICSRRKRRGALRARLPHFPERDLLWALQAPILPRIGAVRKGRAPGTPVLRRYCLCRSSSNVNLACITGPFPSRTSIAIWCPRMLSALVQIVCLAISTNERAASIWTACRVGSSILLHRPQVRHYRASQNSTVPWAPNPRSRRKRRSGALLRRLQTG
jgi:hypothetical protein